MVDATGLNMREKEVLSELKVLGINPSNLERCQSPDFVYDGAIGIEVISENGSITPKQIMSIDDKGLSYLVIFMREDKSRVITFNIGTMEYVDSGWCSSTWDYIRYLPTRLISTKDYLDTNSRREGFSDSMVRRFDRRRKYNANWL